MKIFLKTVVIKINVLNVNISLQKFLKKALDLKLFIYGAKHFIIILVKIQLKENEGTFTLRKTPNGILFFESTS